MPIVAGVGGNAGTQTLAVTVRALATNQLTGFEPLGGRSGARCESRFSNGLTIAVLIGIGVDLIVSAVRMLGGVIAAAQC